MDNRQTSHQMIDRALAIAGVAIPIIGAFLPEVSSKIPRKLNGFPFGSAYFFWLLRQ